MSNRPIALRLRASSEFTCSRCGGHEAYSCQGRRTFERYVLKAMMVRSLRCCDCDSLCYAFPIRRDDPILSGIERTAAVIKPQRTETRERGVYGGAAAHILRNRLGQATRMLPSASH